MTLHLYGQALDAFQAEHNFLPRPCNVEDADEIIATIEALMQKVSSLILVHSFYHVHAGLSNQILIL